MSEDKNSLLDVSPAVKAFGAGTVLALLVVVYIGYQAYQKSRTPDVDPAVLAKQAEYRDTIRKDQVSKIEAGLSKAKASVLANSGYVPGVTPKTQGSLPKDIFAPPDNTPGAREFENNQCGGCHSIDGSVRASGGGPSLKDLLGRTETLIDGTTLVVDEAYIKESIKKPQAKIVKAPAGVKYTVMQSFAHLSDNDVSLLVEYIKAQKTPVKATDGEGAEAGEPAEGEGAEGASGGSEAAPASGETEERGRPAFPM